MNATFTSPHGHKVRTQSQRRYVVIKSDDRGAYVHKRSDNIDIARQARRRSPSVTFIYDTVKGEYVDR